MSFNGIKEPYPISKYILDKLTSENFTIHFHESIQANSSHIKLDYGLQNTIRISDTPGPKHYGYKYNVVIGLRQSHSINYDSFKKFYYSLDDIDEMIKTIVSTRNSRVKYMGDDTYDKQMKEQKVNFASGQGFWKNSKQISERISTAIPKLF